ncbi:hypothetical protein SAMN05443252_105366 [Bacillus sp. OV322]|uniref:hypothetical protein n=1 Tax=Bacillus sp. OV322 TaxID=1882764 RepID=UPI0008ED9DCE|nr:hypothetical protein [Bacillus sp. OV322]SFC70244.1 hypothetical protein SAMN05443252_105366 [Bacillus sp. OV322]
MIKTIILKNESEVYKIMQDLIERAYVEASEEKLLLCMECGDVDFYIALAHNEELQDAIKENFEVDEYGEVLDEEKYRKMLDDLQDNFLEMHIKSGLFDYYPAGEYDVAGEKRQSETDIIAPKGKFSAPFEDAAL